MRKFCKQLLPYAVALGWLNIAATCAMLAFDVQTLPVILTLSAISAAVLLPFVFVVTVQQMDHEFETKRMRELGEATGRMMRPLGFGSHLYSDPRPYIPQLTACLILLGCFAMLMWNGSDHAPPLVLLAMANAAMLTAVKQSVYRWPRRYAEDEE